ncbi:MAG: hypothetical protein Rubg2KO_23580 [Rubricoccaceae bacterium]
MMRRWLLLVGLAMGFASSSHAQAVGQCVTGTAIAFLENAELRASVFNTGSLFFGGSTTSGDGYLIPKAAEVSPLFAVSFNLGGTVNGDLRKAGARYGNWDFWPGPLEDAARPPEDCSEHDRIYLVSREDIRRYYETGQAAPDLAEWPYQLGAPVIDGDGDSTNYDLRAGDQPDLIGDMAAWWVMNDAGNDHDPGLPLGVEVRVHAFVYGRDEEVLSPALSQTSFYRYEIVNRSEAVIDSMYAMMYVDADVGDAGDDYMGTDTLRNMIFAFNDSNEDGAYGTAPPAQGVQILQGPIGLANGRDDDFDGLVDEPGERQGATSSNTCELGTRCPYTIEDYDYYMRGLWADGTPQYESGHGWGPQVGAAVTRFWFTGDPVTESFWSAMNIDDSGRQASPGDYRMMMSTGPFRLNPGESAGIFYAFPFGRGSDYLQSVAVMRGHAFALQDAHAAGFFASSPVAQSEPTFELTLTRVRPNPSSGAAQALLTLPETAHVRAVVVDMLGRQLEVLVDGELARGETVLEMPHELAPGRYLLRVEVTPGVEETIPFTVAR